MPIPGVAIRALLGFLSIVAIRLLQVETLARHCPQLPAREAVDAAMLESLAKLLHRDAADITVYLFWREIANMVVRRTEAGSETVAVCFGACCEMHADWITHLLLEK